MASLHLVIDPVYAIRKPKEKGADLEPDTRESEKLIHKETIVKILERAANNPAFIAQLTYQGSKALRGYNLTLEEKAALVSGDINWIEAHIGKLDERLSTWPRCRLQQEIW
jgi:hypothetical protein